MPGLIQYFKNKSRRTQHKTNQQRTDGAFAIQPRPQNSEYETHRNRRTDVRLYALQINVQLRAEQMNEGHPQKSQQHHGASSDASEVHQLLFAGGGPELFIKIERDHGGSRIKNGTHGTHQRG